MSLVVICMQCRVQLEDAISGVHTQLRTLDDRILRIDEPFVTPQTVKVIQNEGMLNRKVPYATIVYDMNVICRSKTNAEI